MQSFLVPRGTTVREAARKVSHDLGRYFAYAESASKQRVTSHFVAAFSCLLCVWDSITARLLLLFRLTCLQQMGEDEVVTKNNNVFKIVLDTKKVVDCS